ncbi:tetratricopeptide repeat protein [bacterium]|nr:tetratricopeptide repeat protein [bacterium]
MARKQIVFLFIAALLLQQSLLQAAASAEEPPSTIEGAELLCREKVVAWTVTSGDNSDFIAAALDNLAALYRENSRPDDAIAKYREALAVREKAPKPSAALIATSQLKLAECLTLAHRDAEAEPLLFAAFATQAKLLGTDNPNIQETKKKLALCYRNQKKFASAEILFKELLATIKKHIERSRTSLVWMDELCYAEELGDLIDIYMRQTKWADAIPLSQQLLATYQSIPSNYPDQVSRPSALLTMGICYSEDGQHLLAEPLFQQALELLQTSRKHEPSYVAIVLTKQANNLAAMAKYNQAEVLYKEALSIWGRVNRPGDGDQLDTITGYLALLNKTNRISEATKLQAQAARIKEHFVFTRLPLPRSCMNCWGTLEFGGPNIEFEPIKPPN